MLPTDPAPMRLALRLARCGYGFTFTNPMVGAVIVAPSGRVIGRGWHRRYGGPHAEVNAIRSISPADVSLLPESTIYVTLEPCSHYGKTPPCANLLIEKRLRRVVVGVRDPFPEVSGRGIRMLREAGIEVTVGVLERECYELNLPFMRAHEMGRPFVTLKWARSADGFIAPAWDGDDAPERVVFSSAQGNLTVHRLRASCQGVMVGTRTVLADNPRLDCRLWPVLNQPVPLLRESARLPEDAAVMGRSPVMRHRDESLSGFLRRLYTEYKMNHILVEGGAEVLREFLEEGLFDALRVETSPVSLGAGVPAPSYDPSALVLRKSVVCRGNSILYYLRKD
ncbi:MAG: bifunctional diaminohydroxyphosphoribosylaminopyrimidine deaminase/5-amino-6-(5-phosphoribosylamino)uracil reductase RibD [Muribaculaceae bacterium]|nr:bifunctional diaminohydroxyphosphoribosylaminopyrimidine deaminase/5-amino-6-(5-phosphoribosylamino)uracil reductase RibD [Muribaculaceae bacterium]